MEKTSNNSLGKLKEFFSRTVKDYSIIYILLVLIILLSFSSKYFLTSDNMINVIRQASIFGILAAGEFFIIISGMIDLSIGSTAALAGIVFTIIYKAGGLASMPVAIIGGLIVGIMVGFINGFLTSRLRIVPFIATLGTMLAVRGVDYMITGAFPIIDLAKGFDFMGRGFLLGIPFPVIVMLAVYLIIIIFSEKKKTGRFFYAIGGNEEASHLSGINVKNIKLLAYVVCGLMAAIGGIILMSRLGSGQPNAAISYEFQAIIAVVLGGVSFSGGKGKALNVLFGTLFVAMLVNGMTLINIDSFTQQVIQGVVFIVAIWNDVARNQTGR